VVIERLLEARKGHWPILGSGTNYDSTRHGADWRMDSAFGVAFSHDLDGLDCSVKIIVICSSHIPPRKGDHMEAESEENRLYRELADARDKWMTASTELNNALRHREDLLNVDGRFRLHKAREAHRQAMQDYYDALDRFAAWVFAARRPQRTIVA